MKTVALRNKELLSIIESFLEQWKKTDRTQYKIDKPSEERMTLEYCVSDDYLKEMQAKPSVTGFPEQTRGVNMSFYRPPGLNKALDQLDADLIAWSGSRFNAVKMYYPVQGFMGWHHNANCPGYNILLSWSPSGSGFFRYQDPDTKEIVTIPDTPGWSAKCGYYGSWNEKKQIYWHCAATPTEERITLGYVIPHEGLWEDMVADIERV